MGLQTCNPETCLLSTQEEPQTPESDPNSSRDDGGLSAGWATGIQEHDPGGFFLEAAEASKKEKHTQCK